MKAKYINETNFERGKDPFDAMSIGDVAGRIERLDNAKRKIATKLIHDIYKIIGPYMKHAHELAKKYGYDNYWDYSNTTLDIGAGREEEIEKWIWNVVDIKIKELLKDYKLEDMSHEVIDYPPPGTLITSFVSKMPDSVIKESINFERGKDPLDAMEIGRRPQLLKLMQDLHMNRIEFMLKHFGYINEEMAGALLMILWKIYFDKYDTSNAYNVIVKAKDFRLDEYQKHLIKVFLENTLDLNINK